MEELEDLFNEDDYSMIGLRTNLASAHENAALLAKKPAPNTEAGWVDFVSQVGVAMRCLTWKQTNPYSPAITETLKCFCPEPFWWWQSYLWLENLSPPPFPSSPPNYLLIGDVSQLKNCFSVGPQSAQQPRRPKSHGKEARTESVASTEAEPVAPMILDQQVRQIEEQMRKVGSF